MSAVRSATPGIAVPVKAIAPQKILQFNAVTDLQQSPDTALKQILKTLVITLHRELAVAILPVLSWLSLKTAAAALGMTKTNMAEPAAAQRVTGYVIGGISPFGQRQQLQTIADVSVLSWDRMLCNAGKQYWECRGEPTQPGPVDRHNHR